MNLASSWCWKPEAVLTQTQMPVTSTRVRLTDQQTSMVVKPDKRVRLGVRALGEFGWMWSILIRTEIRLGCLISNAWTALWLVIAQIWKTIARPKFMDHLWIYDYRIFSRSEVKAKARDALGILAKKTSKLAREPFMHKNESATILCQTADGLIGPVNPLKSTEVGDGWHLDIFWT